MLTDAQIERIKRLSNLAKLAEENEIAIAGLLKVIPYDVLTFDDCQRLLEILPSGYAHIRVRILADKLPKDDTGNGMTSQQFEEVVRVTRMIGNADKLTHEVVALQDEAIPWDDLTNADLHTLEDVLNFGYCFFKVLHRLQFDPIHADNLFNKEARP